MPSGALLRFVVAALALKAWLILFLWFDWDAGITRGVLLAAGLAALLPILQAKPGTLAAGDHAWLGGLNLALALAASLAVALGLLSVINTARSGDPLLDQGQNLIRSARVLLGGENPYAAGMLLDPAAFKERAAARAAAGLAPQAPEGERAAIAERYWHTLDPALRARLLPPPAPGDAEAAREYALLGYKYGPVPLLATAALWPILGAAAVPILNLLAVLAWAAVLGLVLRRSGWSSVLSFTGALLALADPHVGFTLLYLTALDAWPLLFGALAVLAVLTKRPVLVAVSLALAVGCKLFPSLIYMPLLLLTGKPLRSVGVFAALVATLYLPWLAWDAGGLINNVLLWPALMQPDTTSWVVYAGGGPGLALRLVLLAAVAAVSLWLIRRGGARRIVWSLAFLSLAVVCAGSAIHNNYLPWFSGWYALALIVCLIAPERDEVT